MESRQPNDLRQLKLRNQIRFLIYLYWLRIQEQIKLLLRPSRSRVHWIGKRTRRARPERAFIILTFISAMLLLKPYEYAVWATMVGGFTSFAVTLHSVYRLIPRKEN